MTYLLTYLNEIVSVNVTRILLMAGLKFNFARNDVVFVRYQNNFGFLLEISNFGFGNYQIDIQFVFFVSIRIDFTWIGSYG